MMTPSRIRSAAGAANYYGKDDYYVTGEAGAPGIAWSGRGADALGLSGLASGRDFQSVLAGRNPDPEGPDLSSAGGNRKHHPGWDFTFTVPKSVSLAIVAAERHDPALAARLEGHVLAANAAMMRHLEDNHAFTRVRGAGGEIREVQTGNLVFASVLHRTTRGGDPHFHVHNPTANTTRNPETGAWGALETRHIYKWQQLASQVGARELQARLLGEGFNLERHGELKWEIAGVDPALLAAFSRRAAEIDAAGATLASDRGVERLSPAQRDMIQKQTRKAKSPVDRDKLADDWAARAAGLDAGALEQILLRSREPGRDVTPTIVGRITPSLQALSRGLRVLTGQEAKTDAFATGPGRDPDPEARRLIAFGVKVVEAGSAVSSRYAALLAAVRVAPAGVRVDRLEGGLGRLTRDGHVVAADRSVPGGITTRRMVAVEQEIVAAVAAGKGAARPMMSQAAADRALQAASQFDILNHGQRGAITGLLTSTDRIRAVPGFAGVGKTFAFATLAEIAADHGQRLHGLSSVNTHVQQLRDGAGIPAQSIASWLQSVEAGLGAGREAATQTRTRWSGAHLIVDEASTLTNESAFQVLRAAADLGIASVTIAGDRRQTGGPGAGNVFKAVLDRGIDQLPLTAILRQARADPALREGVRDLAEGRLRAGMTKLAPHVHAVGAGATDVEVAARAVALWSERRAAGMETVLITATNRMRALQSVMARDVLRNAGVLRGEDESRLRLSRKHLTRPEQFAAGSYALGDVIVPDAAFAGRGPTAAERSTVIGIDLANNLLEVQAGRRLARQVDLTREHAKGRPRFSVYGASAHDVAEGERLTWEARFRDRGYERGAEFTVVRKTAATWTLRHADGRTERLSAQDPALNFTSHAYAMTTERAQGRTIEAPVATMTTREGQAVAETKNYVNWSRLTRAADLVTDDAPRVLTMLARNDGQKLVALDHVRDAWENAGKRGDFSPSAGAPAPTLEVGQHDRTLTR